MVDLVLFGVLAAVLYATWYWWPVSAWVVAGITLYIIISDEIDWWRNERPKCRTAAERRRSYIADWAARLGMLEVSAMLDGRQPTPDGYDEGTVRKRVIAKGIFSVGAFVVVATLILGWGSGFLAADPKNRDNAGRDSEHTSVTDVVDNGYAQELDTSTQTELQQFVATNFADDLARCRAYLTLAANGSPGQAPVTRTSATDEIDALLLMTAGSVETAAAKHRLQLDTMTREMDGSFNNFSRLIVKHGEFCADLLRDPTPRLEYWMARARQQLQR